MRYDIEFWLTLLAIILMVIVLSMVNKRFWFSYFERKERGQYHRVYDILTHKVQRIPIFFVRSRILEVIPKRYELQDERKIGKVKIKVFEVLTVKESEVGSLNVVNTDTVEVGDTVFRVGFTTPKGSEVLNLKLITNEKGKPSLNTYVSCNDDVFHLDEISDFGVLKVEYMKISKSLNWVQVEEG